MAKKASIAAPEIEEKQHIKTSVSILKFCNECGAEIPLVCECCNQKIDESQAREFHKSRSH